MSRSVLLDVDKKRMGGMFDIIADLIKEAISTGTDINSFTLSKYIKTHTKLKGYTREEMFDGGMMFEHIIDELIKRNMVTKQPEKEEETNTPIN